MDNTPKRSTALSLQSCLYLAKSIITSFVSHLGGGKCCCNYIEFLNWQENVIMSWTKNNNLDFPGLNNGVHEWLVVGRRGHWLICYRTSTATE